MSRVTSKLQVTIPKAIAERHRIRPGDDIEWVSAGDTIRIVTEPGEQPSFSVAERLELFDQASERQAQRQRRHRRKTTAGRGWTREELYERGQPG